MPTQEELEELELMKQDLVIHKRLINAYHLLDQPFENLWKKDQDYIKLALKSYYDFYNTEDL